MRPVVENSPQVQVKTVVTVTETERQHILELARGITPDPAADPELFCAAARRAARGLPERVLDALLLFARWGSATGTLLIEGLPVGPVPSTPPDNTYHVGAATVLARAQAMLGEALGHLVAYEAEGYGRLFQDMVPARKKARTQTSLSSFTELELHTEQAFSFLRPDYLSLGCLRGDPAAKTYTLTARQIGALTASVDLDVLWQPRWMTGVDESFRLGGHDFDAGDVRGPLSILSGAEDDPFLVLDQDLMISTGPTAKAAFAAVLELYRVHRNQHVLKPGDVLLVDNNRTVHGRSAFRAQFDGTDRFVLRTFIANDLARSRYARHGNGRLIAARHS